MPLKNWETLFPGRLNMSEPDKTPFYNKEMIMDQHTRSEYKRIIADFPAQLQLSLHGRSEKELDERYRPDGWTVRQVIHHLADAHMNGFIRMKLIMTENLPTLKPYDQDKWANLPDAKRWTIADSLLILMGLHNRGTEFLDNLSEDDWQRKAIHPEIGEVSMTDLLKTYATHCQNHLKQINQVS